PALLSALVILVHISLKSFDLLYALDQRNLKIDTPSLYMWFTTFDGGFLNRGATIATLLLVGVALVIGPYIRYSLRSERVGWRFGACRYGSPRRSRLPVRWCNGSTRSRDAGRPCCGTWRSTGWRRSF